MLYNFKLKQIPLVGNLTIALLSLLVTMSGALAANRETFLDFSGALFAGLFAFYLNLIREIIKDIIDLEGDRKANLKTLPMIVNLRPLLVFCFILYLHFLGLTVFPWFSGWYGIYFEVIVLYLIDLTGLILFIGLLIKSDMKFLKMTASFLKIAMVLGMIALFLSN